MKTNRSIRWVVFAVLMFSLSAASFAQMAVGISVRFGPPAIPVYAQPICPGPGYFWTPGYWAWNDDYGYYWVPGTWVIAPVGMLWTPGYWGWYGGFYRWHPGYWGPHVGFYGGINYGFGYTGFGFWGGEWRGERFYYNRSVTNINVVNVTNVYERRVVVNNYSRVSYNGGSGGISARPTPEEERYERDPHREALADQVHHERAASENRELFASRNHGRPAIAATGRPGEFRGHDIVAAREAGEKYHAPKISPREARVSPGEARNTEGRDRGNSRGTNRENNREINRGNKGESNREANRETNSRTNAHRQVQNEKADRRHEQQQAKEEQKRQQQEVKRQQQQQKADRKRAQQEEKRQRKEQQRSGHEGPGQGPGR